MVMRLSKGSVYYAKWCECEPKIYVKVFMPNVRFLPVSSRCTQSRGEAVHMHYSMTISPKGIQYQ